MAHDNVQKLAEPEISARALASDRLRRAVDPAGLGFATTSELEPASGLIGQDRALGAIRFGASIRQTDFNLFVLGPPGAGKSTAVKAFLERKAADEPAPGDWVYVNNFADPDRPTAIQLPRGRAGSLAQGMIDVVDELRTAIPAMFESDEYQARLRRINESFRQAQEEAFKALEAKAEAENIAVLRTPTGFAMAPTSGGEVIKPEVFNAMAEEERKRISDKIEALQKELAQILEQLPKWEKERRKQIRALNEEVAEVAVRQALAEVAAAFSDVPEVGAYLKAVERDLIHNVGLFVQEGEEEAQQIVSQQVETARDARFRRYMVNVVVTNGEEPAGAPIIEELNPTLANLMGRVEHLAQMGTLVTDFLLIRPGALHKANGGYLLLDARKLLTSPFSWEALKRALRRQQIRIETPAEATGLISTQTLDPDPIDLRVKVVLFGDRELYYLLNALDPEFSHFFKVQADFDDTLDRTEENQAAYAGLIASIVRKYGLRPVASAGVARLIEEGSRLAHDAEKLSIEIGKLADIVREADFWAMEAGRDIISRADVERTIEERTQRADRLRDKAQEAIRREIMLVDTDGERVGQINGLSVITLGDFSFGRPSRITARVRVGPGRVTDIEREVELGGPLHSKGVMILWGFLAGRYGQTMPLALAASLVFEQSYGGVDGDSASSAEVYALLSALSGVPIRQGLAVTGSVNQHGDVQAIGGVNEKIEGFFDICAQRGLTGRQGVLIPKANVQHLMLREDVVEAVNAGRFRVFPIATIDEGIEILTGMRAGRRPDSRSAFPEGTINRMVEDRLRAFAEARRAFGGEKANGGGNDGKATS